MELKDVVAVSAVRTALGGFGGILRDVPVWDMGAVAIKEALEKSGLKGADIDEVIYGNCRQAGNGPNPSRTASVKAGIPVTVPTQTINMACPSGMKTIALASQSIRTGDAKTVVAGGMDSMSSIPYLLKGVRWQGFKMGDKTLLDGWSDSIDPLCGLGMGATAENQAVKYGITREEQDAFALESHQKAAWAQEKGWFDNEIVPVEIPPSKQFPEGIAFLKDESVRKDSSLERLAKLKAAFKPDGGTITAGNACGMTDGACAVILTSRKNAEASGLKPLFSIVSYASTAVEPAIMGDGPSEAIPLVLKNAGMTLDDIDYIEINEAFAAQVLANVKVLNLDKNRLNVHGGAIALGHPTGISGARIIVTLYNILKRTGKETGLASICGGGGVTMAMVIKRES